MCLVNLEKQLTKKTKRSLAFQVDSQNTYTPHRGGKVSKIPVHVLLSLFSAYPALHEQKKFPRKLLHLCWQPLKPVEHSSWSANYIKNTIILLSLFPKPFQ